MVKVKEKDRVRQKRKGSIKNQDQEKSQKESRQKSFDKESRPPLRRPPLCVYICLSQKKITEK